MDSLHWNKPERFTSVVWLHKEIFASNYSGMIIYFHCNEITWFNGKVFKISTNWSYYYCLFPLPPHFFPCAAKYCLNWAKTSVPETPTVNLTTEEIQILFSWSLKLHLEQIKTATEFFNDIQSWAESSRCNNDQKNAECSFINNPENCPVSWRPLPTLGPQITIHSSTHLVSTVASSPHHFICCCHA